MVDYEVIFYFGFEYGINMPPKVGRVCEAASVESPGCLLKGGGKWRVGLKRSSWSGDGRVDIIPNDFISLIVEDRVEKRGDSFKVEAVSIDCCIEI